jgi:hypothetical protein
MKPRIPFPRRKPIAMTVCIAAIAAKSKAIVCIADRALTFAGATASAQSDSGVTKIVDIPNTRWCAMFSGDDLTFPERVLGLTESALSTEKRNHADRAKMESAVKSAFETQWSNEIEDQILKPKLLTKASFTVPRATRDARLLDTTYLNALSEQIASHAHNCSMIFAGFDDAGPHIFMASTPACQIVPCDWQGFQTIGAGEESARNQLIWSEYEKEDELGSVLYDVFNAKVSTEILQGISYAWDWRIIVAGQKPRPLPQRIDRLIDRAWMTLNRSPYSIKLPKKERSPRNWHKRMDKFASELLSGSSPKRRKR